MKASEELTRLRHAVRNDPLNAQLRYLLGVELAEAADYEQAVIELTTAVELEPSLHTARFQLGLLHLTLARPSESLAAWAPLDELAEEAPLKLFKQGLEALIRDDFRSCVDLIGRGMAANTENVPLNRDMALILQKARSALEAASAGAPSASTEDAAIIRTDFSLYSLTRQ